MTKKQKTKKPWGGRFSQDTDKFVEQFTASVNFDNRLAAYDIQVSLAHSKMLQRAGILSAAELKQIEQGLKAIATQIEQGKFQWRQELEDVHMNIEAALIEQIGEVGKKVHTGRSRNDQVATGLRLYLRAELEQVQGLLLDTLSALLQLAEREHATLMPGLTHLQAAQPVTFGHHILAWFEMLKRDLGRMQDCAVRLDVMPLGAAALAGTRYPIDRAYTADLLGFSQVAENSLDAVSDRDFAIEFNAAAAILMMHLSRFSEELILWLSPQFAFIDIADAYCTGSSIMPQKKNPDVAELVRGKTGRVYGDLLALLTVMKGQPLAYNRDNQEDKEQLFDSVDTVKQCLTAYAGLIPSITVQRENMQQALSKGFVVATDLADYLVQKGVPFRDSHTIVGRIVQHAEAEGLGLEQIELSVL
ncbi:MAG: argininosuccinate lyase, partial [Gammaproteobacteria bacterium]